MKGIWKYDFSCEILFNDFATVHHSLLLQLPPVDSMPIVNDQYLSSQVQEVLPPQREGKPDRVGHHHHPMKRSCYNSLESALLKIPMPQGHLVHHHRGAGLPK